MKGSILFRRTTDYSRFGGGEIQQDKLVRRESIITFLYFNIYIDGGIFKYLGLAGYRPFYFNILNSDSLPDTDVLLQLGGYILKIPVLT